MREVHRVLRQYAKAMEAVMRKIDCEQGSEEWLKHRLATPSASMFAKIVTTKGAWSTQADGYINQLIAETEVNL